jgi:hypothetical protein
VVNRCCICSSADDVYFFGRKRDRLDRIALRAVQVVAPIPVCDSHLDWVFSSKARDAYGHFMGAISMALEKDFAKDEASEIDSKPTVAILTILRFYAFVRHFW